MDNGIRLHLPFIQKADHPFALIISDQHMPEMSGNELFKKAIEMTPDTRRIIMTGYSDAKAAAQAINMGAIHRYIKKPWENIALVETIKQELGIYHKIQEKHKLIRITKTQNARLYNFAKNITEKNRQYQRVSWINYR
ncbi:MAG: response regulator [Desulfobacterium sp.]|nr:response regulator [Desulfobacterium sp.]